MAKKCVYRDESSTIELQLSKQWRLHILRLNGSLSPEIIRAARMGTQPDRFSNEPRIGTLPLDWDGSRAVLFALLREMWPGRVEELRLLCDLNDGTMPVDPRSQQVHLF